MPLINSCNKNERYFLDSGSYNDEMNYFYNKIMTVRRVRPRGDIYVEEDKHTSRGNFHNGWIWDSSWLRKVDI